MPALLLPPFLTAPSLLAGALALLPPLASTLLVPALAACLRVLALWSAPFPLGAFPPAPRAGCAPDALEGLAGAGCAAAAGAGIVAAAGGWLVPAASREKAICPMNAGDPAGWHLSDGVPRSAELELPAAASGAWLLHARA
eukprot:scaffold1991_cov111-Isochrysis_galbana.AAC.14